MSLKINIQTYAITLFFVFLSMIQISSSAQTLEKAEDYIKIAFAAGAGSQCGLSTEESNKALKKIDFVLTCKFKDSTLSKDDVTRYLIMADSEFKKGRDNPPAFPLTVCKSISTLVRQVNKISACQRQRRPLGKGISKASIPLGDLKSGDGD